MAKPKQPSTDSLPKAPPITAQVAATGAAQASGTQAGAAQTALEPPRTVRTAAKLMYAGAVLSALDLIITLATVGQAKSALHAARPHLSPASLQAAVNAGIATSVVTWIIAIAFWIVMARTNLAGRGWARIVSTVLCVLSTLSFAEDVIRPGSLLSTLIFVPLWLAGVGAIVLLWRPETTAYIRSDRA